MANKLFVTAPIIANVRVWIFVRVLSGYQVELAQRSMCQCEADDQDFRILKGRLTLTLIHLDYVAGAN
jgi:hypothetical protein